MLLLPLLFSYYVIICFTGVDSNQDVIWCVKIGIYIPWYGFLGTSRFLTTYNICPPVVSLGVGMFFRIYLVLVVFIISLTE